MSDTDKEIAILENIYSKPKNTRQRDLAHIAGISLGMTNSILKRLIGKGLLTAQKINHRNIHYAVTPAGINEIMKRSYRFFKRTIKNIVVYKEKIDELVVSIKTKGFTRIVLVGKSDLDFLVEHCSSHHGIEYKRDENPPSSAAGMDNNRTYYIVSEKNRGGSALPEDSSTALFDNLKTIKREKTNA